MRSPLRPRLLVVAATAILGVTVAAQAVSTSQQSERPAPAHRYEAVAFDYFVLFNPDSVVAEVESAFPGKGRVLTNLWRTRQFEYAWLRSIANQYADFLEVTQDALVYAAHAMHVDLSAAEKARLVSAYLRLDPWPDTPSGLRQLREANVRVITIANFSPKMLQAIAEHAGLTAGFDALLSTDANHSYKPEARAYQLGVDWLRLPKSEIVFAASAGWDAAGAKAFGYPTVWVNRFDQPIEELGLRPDVTVTNFAGLLDVALGKTAVRSK